jgi:SAM-dependent methyltransferase
MTDSVYRPCPACGSVKRKAIGSKNGFDILSCSGCGTVYTAFLPNSDETLDYDEYYSESNLSVPAFINERVKEIVAKFSSYRNENRLLEIGFGAGTILEAADDAGWQTYGLEVSKPAIDRALAREFQVFHGTLREAAYPSDHFDVVVASEILEHLDAPQEELEEIYRILRPGGLFWGTTPASSGISGRLLGIDWSMLSPPEHTQLYSRKGLRLMLTNAGFKRCNLQTHGTNPLEILNHLWRGRTNTERFDRVGTGYALNERLTKSPTRKVIKSTINSSLNLLGLGDSLKFFAEKPNIIRA